MESVLGVSLMVVFCLGIMWAIKTALRLSNGPRWTYDPAKPKCAVCETQDPFWFNEDKALCAHCSQKADDEEERRIAQCREIVARLAEKCPEGTYREHGGDAILWARAKEIVENDPYRAKRFDKFVRM